MQWCSFEAWNNQGLLIAGFDKKPFALVQHSQTSFRYFFKLNPIAFCNNSHIRHNYGNMILVFEAEN